MRISEPIAIIVIICLLLASALIVLDIMSFVELKRKKKGKWIETKRNVMGEGFMWKCSVCANEVYVSSKGDFPKYCDECGADMRGEE